MADDCWLGHKLMNVLLALEATNGNKAAAARLIGCTYRSIFNYCRILKERGVEIPENKQAKKDSRK